jgi:hypothetical protein
LLRFITCLLLGGDRFLEDTLGAYAVEADVPEIDCEMERGERMLLGSPLPCEGTEDASVAYPVELAGVKRVGGRVEDGLAD